MNLRQRLVWTFAPLGLASLVLGALVLWWVLDDTQQRQAEFLQSVMTEDVRLHAEYQHQVLQATFDHLLETMARATAHLSSRPDFIAFLEKSQPEPLALILRRFTEINRLDFALVFDRDGQVVASAANNEDDIRIRRQFARSDLFGHLRPRLFDLEQDPAQHPARRPGARQGCPLPGDDLPRRQAIVATGG